MFEEIYNEFNWDAVKEKINSSTENDFFQSVEKRDKDIDDLYPLLSPAADKHLEKMARLSYDITRMRFGNAIQLYTPLYISNECTNACVYCGFNVRNRIKRITLTPEEVEKEAEIIYNSGFRHILLLTGEDRRAVPIDDLAGIAKKIHKKFASVSIEVYPMDTDEYSKMIESGIDGLTLYQETYNHDLYKELHPSGNKSNFLKRINSPDMGGKAGLRRIGIGALLGLADWRVESFFTTLHASYLMRKYWKSHTQVSFPRIREAPGGFKPLTAVTDRDLVHMVCAIRIMLPDAGLVLSTREPADLRDNIIPIGITSISAGSKTSPGGYSDPGLADKQFNIEDSRTPAEIARMLSRKGFDPVWKDWDRGFLV